MHVDLGTLTRVDPGQFGAVGGRDRRADRAVALSYTDVVTQTACWEERSQVCDEIRLALAEVRRRTPSAEPAWGPRGTTPRLTVRGTAAGAPPPPPPPPPPQYVGQWAVGILLCIFSLHGAVGSRDRVVRCLTTWGGGHGGSFYTLSQCMGQLATGILLYTAALHGAVGSGDPFVHFLTAWGDRQ